ncbi:MAG: hypothetical protein AAF573_10820 [Bacteroidota bacterium]
MKKHHNKTDRIIKDKLEHHSMDAPMHLFAGIADALDAETATAVPEKKSGRKRWWLLSLLLLVALGGGTWYGLSQDDKANNSDGEELSLMTNQGVENTTASKNITDNQTIEGQTVTTNSLNSEGNLNTAFFENENNIKSNLENAITNSNLSQQTSSKKITSQRDNNSDDGSAISKPDEQQLSTAKFDLTTSTFTEKGGTDKFGTNTNTANSSSTTNISDIKSEENSNTSTANDWNETTATDASPSNLVTINKFSPTARAAKEVFNLPRFDRRKITKQTTDSAYNLDLEPRCGIKPDGSKIRFTTSVDAFFSPDFASQILEYKSTDYIEYAEMRNATEQASISFNTGLRVNFLTEFNWAIRTGLVYTQINELLRAEFPQTIINYDNNGNIISETPGTREVRIRNSIRMIDFPIIIGYEAKMKKFILNINAGAYVNINAEQRGAIFSSLVNDIIHFTEGHQDDYDIFRDRVGVSAFFGLGFNFDLGNKMQLIVEPHVRYYPKSFTIENYILNQKYVTGGLMIGVRRDL